MATIFTNEIYFIKRLNATRLCIVYGDDVLCKYDDTAEGIRDLIADFIYFAVEDKLISRAVEVQRAEKQKLMELLQG